MEAAAETVRLAPLDETLKPLLPEPEESDPLVDSNPNPLDSMPRQPAVDLSSQPISTFLASASPEPHAPALEPDFPEALESDLFAETPAETGERSQGPEGDQAAPEPKEEEVSLTMSNSNFVIALRVTKGIDAATLGQLVQVLRGFVGAEDRVVAVGAAADLAGLPAGTLQVATDGKAEGAAFAEAVSLHPGAGILLTTTTEVIFDANALALFAEALRGSAPLAYADYREDRDGAVSDVRLHDHEGCPHERFEFGPVIAYDLNAVEAVGGIRTDLNFAWEYDLHLKLMEQAEFAHIKQIAYTRFVPVVVDEKGKKVFSPGMGPLGGFSYVFYPEAVEREVTSVFEEALHRRGAWIDHPPAVVDHSGRTYETLASIVIPILNRVKYIANAIEKVQKGTFPNFEMIIVDNGSTDGTIDVVKNIAAQDPRIRLLHGKGGSIASALNEGIKAARGKYICQLDSDDEYAPDCLELMIGHLESHPTCGLAISYYRLMDENGAIIEDVAPITHSGYSRNQILRRDGAGAVRIFPKVVLEEFGYYDEVHYGNFGEDYDMVLKTGEKYSVDRVHKVLYHYRRHADNTDVTRDPEMKYKNKNRARQEALRRRKEINLALASA
jgi:GT2 family glycosyltransferase